MEEIKVGEYCRTEYGICKLERYTEYGALYFDKLHENLWSGDFQGVLYPCDIEDTVIKHSFNILELIECGDILEVEVGGFVHKYEIYASTDYSRAIHDVNYGTKDLEEYISDYCNGKFNIITHEQLNSIKYEVI